MEALNLAELQRALKNNVNVNRILSSTEQKRFDLAKSQLLQEFDTHPITIEILEGVEAENLSGTLGGVGNLYTFIGFPNGSTPIQAVREILEVSLLLENPTVDNSQLGFDYNFPVYLPTEELIAATPMPFETGNSWLVGIENGIAGFSNFIYRASNASRSGKGIEVKGLVNAGTFQPTPYLLNMLSKFTERINNVRSGVV